MILSRLSRNNFIKRISTPRVACRSYSWLLTIIAASTLSLVSIPALAAPLPSGVNHQGFLTDNQGRPINGAIKVEARLYTTATSGTIAYSENHDVQVRFGLYNLTLGLPPNDAKALQSALGDGAIYLELAINGKALSPRTQLQATPFAIWSQSVGPAAIDSQHIVDGAITAAKIAPGAINQDTLDDGFKRDFDSKFHALKPLLNEDPLEPSKLRETVCPAPPQLPLSLIINGQVFAQVLAFQSDEVISALPRTVVLFQSDARASPVSWLDTNARLSIVGTGSARHFAGIVTHAARLGGSPSTLPNVARFAVVIEPPMARLRYSQRSRIFQEQSALEIVLEYLDTVSQSHFEVLNQLPIPRTQVVQYQESDLTFAQRLLEREGIWFAIDTESTTPAMLLSDNNATDFGAVALSYYGPNAEPSVASEQYVLAWLADNAQHANSVSLKAYPNQNGLVLEESFSLGTGIGSLRRSGARTEGAQDLADRARSQAQEAWHQQHRSGGFSNASRLSPGRRINIVDRSGAGQSGDYWLTGVYHTGMVVGERDVCLHYANRFSIAPASIPFRPQRVTATPTIPGLSSGIVTGPNGETRHTDELGRVKVQFHWDDVGQADDNASAWIPVLKSFHGRNQSAFWIPEVGDEVLVSFIDGDPDRPVVVGAIANDSQPPPSALPENKNLTTIRSRSSTGTLTELEWDSTAGAESLKAASRNVNIDAQDEVRLNASTIVLDSPLQSNTTLGAEKPPLAGGYYRDNAIIAWARISTAGTVQPSFGVTEVSKTDTGRYIVDITRNLTATRIIPVAIAEIDRQPQSLEQMRIVSINQTLPGVFEIYVNDGNGKAIDNDIIFIATGG